MAVTTVPSQDPTQSQLVSGGTTSPYSLSWWTTQFLTDIPADSVGWLVAQGWQITDVSYDQSTVPPTPSYAMYRESMQNWQILQSMLNSYTTAYNEARLFNDTRYNEVVTDWTEMLTTSQTHFGVQTTEQNAQVAIFLADLDTYMDDVDSLIDANQSQIAADAAVATTALTALNTKLSDLEDNVTNHTVTITGLLDAQSGYLSTFLTDFAAELAELDTNYSAHLTTIQSLLSAADADLTTFTATQAAELTALEAAYTAHVATLDALLAAASAHLTTLASDIGTLLATILSDYNSLESDYYTHTAATVTLLDGLGTTEEARINEDFAASLAKQIQQLTDQGLYTSADLGDITARNTRDRDQQIQLMKDRLNREKLANQHKTYSQRTEVHQLLQSVRDRTLAGKQTLYSLRDASARLNIEVQSRLHDTGLTVKRLLIEEAGRLHQLQQVVTQWETGQRDKLLEQVQGIVVQQASRIERQHAAQQDVSKVATSERDRLQGHLQDAVKGFIAGKERYSALTMQNASTLAEHKHRAIVEKMNEYAARLEGLRGQHADNMRLMAYQLDERNKLLVGLYGFVERRDDVGPRFEEFAKICTSLGDAGGGWVTP